MRQGRARRIAVCLMTGFFLLSASVIAPHQVHAQESVDDRLDRLERDLSQLQRQVDHGDASGNTETPPPPADGSAPATGGTQALNVQMRLDALDAQIRQLNGQLEENQFGISQMKDRLDKMQKDEEQRFQALEHPSGAGPANAAAADAPGSPDMANSNSGQPGYAGGSGFLVPPGSSPPAQAGAPPPGNSGDPAGADPADSAPPAAIKLPAGTAQQQYSFAFNLLKRSKYDAADQAFRAFLQAHPKDPLAGSAQYWLGDIYFVHKQYDKAVPIFAAGYQKYPRGPKAADNLLKLGISLGNTGHKAEACAAFGRLDRDFPNAPPSVKANERGEKRRLGC